jgi:hypothetical protein
MKLKRDISLGLLFLATGCVSYKHPSSSYISMPRNDVNDHLRFEASVNYLYNIIPRNSEQIRFYDIPHWTTWAILGNQEDGIFGEDQDSLYSTNLNTWTAIKWGTRNPFHNFCFHVPPFGTKDVKFDHHMTLVNISSDENYFLRFGKDDARTFGKGKAGFVLGFYPLPFVSLRIPYFPPFEKNRLEFYIGKRPHGLGLKLLPHGEVRD